MHPALLDRAVELAVRNAENGQLPFGAVLARGDEVVATGVNTALRDNDPVAHAEVEAVRAGCRELGTQWLEGLTLYSSCEPCPICHTVAVAAGIQEIFYAAPKEFVPDLGGPPFSPLLGQVQVAARELDPDRIRHVPTENARDPFTTYLERGQVKLGLNIPNYGPGMGPRALRGWARFAEETGFSIAMISDHIAVTPEVQALYPVPFYDPFTSITWLAAHTETLELGTSVTVLPYRHPLQTARISANIDQLSGGRFVLGVGSGWSREEYRALGVPFERRGALTDEYLATITAHWTSEVTTWDGLDIHTGPAPVRRLPVWVGGASPPALRRVIKYGDAWHPINPRPHWLQQTGMPALATAAENANAPVPPLCVRIRAHPTDHALEDDERVLGEGTLDQIRADLDGLAELGAAYVVLDTYIGPAERRTAEDDWRILETVAKLTTT